MKVLDYARQRVRPALALAAGFILGLWMCSRVQAQVVVPIDINKRPLTLVIGLDQLNPATQSNPLPVQVQGPGTFNTAAQTTAVTVGTSAVQIPPAGALAGQGLVTIYGASANTGRLFCMVGTGSSAVAISGATQGEEIGPDGQRNYWVGPNLPVYCIANAAGQKAVVSQFR